VLLTHEADINAEVKLCKNYSDGEDYCKKYLATPLGLAAAAHTNIDIVKLLEKGANVNAMSNNTTPLIKAVDKNNAKMVKLLLQHHADPEIPAKDTGHTPLATASMQRYAKIV
jgi:ankyrin repeat protein